MLKMIYTVPPDKKASEIAWLRDQKIFPATEDTVDWLAEPPKVMVRFGVVVSEDAALAIKLRHNLDRQTEYKQRQR